MPAPELYKIGYINVCKRAKTIIIIFYSNFRDIYGLFLGGHRGPKIQTCSHKGKKMLKIGKKTCQHFIFFFKKGQTTRFSRLCFPDNSLRLLFKKLRREKVRPKDSES